VLPARKATSADPLMPVGCALALDTRGGYSEPMTWDSRAAFTTPVLMRNTSSGYLNSLGKLHMS
jgi:hypothetical protein